VNIHASSLQTFGTYNDLASVTARYLPALTVDPGPSFNATVPTRLLTNTRPPKSLYTISIGFPLPFDRSWLNVGYLNQVLDDRTRSDIINVSYSRSLAANASLYLTAFSNIANKRNSGVFFVLSLPFGGSPSTGA